VSGELDEGRAHDRRDAALVSDDDHDCSSGQIARFAPCWRMPVCQVAEFGGE
jgi:hypothetical protein